MTIVHLFHCPSHVYAGHHGRPPGTAPMIDTPALRLVAGRGVEGDRYFGVGAASQVTFFAEEVWLRLCTELGRVDRSPAVFRRNVIVRGADLKALIGADFEVQGVRFHGVEHCRPCYWMDQAFAPGAADWLKGRGGLRAIILSDGWLRRDPQ